MSKFIIIDYGMGNVNSVRKKLKQFDKEVIVSSNPNLIVKADKLIIPGVGHFKKAIENIKNLQLVDVLNEAVLVKKIPILGICLGMQLMAKHSEEGDVEGLGWFDADILKFQVKDKLKYKVPHMGWNSLTIEKNSPILKDIPQEAMFYFVHSFHIKCNQKEDVLSTTDYEYTFESSIQKDNIFGTQFHPEKSHEWGAKLLVNFINL